MPKQSIALRALRDIKNREKEVPVSISFVCEKELGDAILVVKEHLGADDMRLFVASIFRNSKIIELAKSLSQASDTGER